MPERSQDLLLPISIQIQLLMSPHHQFTSLPRSSSLHGGLLFPLHDRCVFFILSNVNSVHMFGVWATGFHLTAEAHPTTASCFTFFLFICSFGAHRTNLVLMTLWFFPSMKFRRLNPDILPNRIVLLLLRYLHRRAPRQRTTMQKNL